MAYIGRPLNAGNLAVQSGTGDGSDTTPIATLDYSVGSSNSVAVYLDGVRQLAGTDFTAAGTTLTFTTAPANGVGIDVYFLGLELSIPTPADATVTAAKLASNAVTTAKIIANAVDETKLKDALVADFTEVTVTASDSILLGDATDSGNTKRDTVQGILDLAGSSYKIGNSSRAMSSTGTQTISGIGFTPALVYILGVRGTNHEVSWGFSNSTAQYVLIDRHGGTANAYTSLASFTVSMYETNTVWFKGSVGNFADGSFDIVWTKNGSPAATCYFGYLAIGS